MQEKHNIGDRSSGKGNIYENAVQQRKEEEKRDKEMKFWLFLLFRGIVGIGEASYVTVAPTMIADMSTGRNRSRMLMLFYFAIPFGSGLGFIVGSRVAAITGRWEWGVRVSVILGELNP
ncbi:hypothetical protein ANCDUO_04623 [Ancylostoma duodenale]|uniref:Major facilitator superfamily (MFS) profile domain-containing protein n=1 Tax=Ancylostoma duodenale TaxID=51022 RepID=A0A0C2DQR6_9BILA|nr:hypothetical protein ANCDUO_04623 [Ancylostoma duodenale]